MSGQFKGVQSILNLNIQKQLHVHCSTHSLNLAVSAASGIKQIRNCLDIIERHLIFLILQKEILLYYKRLKNLTTHPI